MTFVIDPPTFNCPDIVRQNIQHLNFEQSSDHQPNAFSLTSENSSRNLNISQPIPVYDVFASNTLSESKISPLLTGYICFVFEGDEVISIADVDPGEENDDPSFLYFTKGEIVGQIASTINNLENLENLDQKDYKLRLLRINAVNMVSIWLHGDDDVVVEVDSKSSEYNLLTFQELLAQITEQLEDLKYINSVAPN